mmetsp:Transcript_5594/g.7000  ORF Transcript_5594/g.7000 Transcript_5594/m.7000 type:complete len:121 (+) Transcript_5594:722-1084(+)
MSCLVRELQHRSFINLLIDTSFQKYPVFLHAVYLYKFEESSNFQYERYKSMAATFIQSNAPYEINISYRVKSELLSWCENEKVEEGSNLRQDEIFDPACKEMFDLLYTNFFAKNASFCSF